MGAAITIQREYYPLADAAKRLGCTEADLVHLAATGRLKIWSMFDKTTKISVLFTGTPGKIDERYIHADFVYAGERYFRCIESGDLEPRASIFRVEGIGLACYTGLDEDRPRLSHFLKSHDIERMERDSVRRWLAAGVSTRGSPPETLPETPTRSRLNKAIELFDKATPPRSKKAFMGKLESIGCDTREQEVFARIVGEECGHKWRD